MKITLSEATEYGRGVSIILTGDEVATAIDSYLVSRNVVVRGPRTITMEGELLKETRVYVDPSGSVINNSTPDGGEPVTVEDEHWNTMKPINEVWVNVINEDDGTIHEARAIYGRSGLLPHWELRNGDLCSPNTFRKWKFL